MSRTTSVTIGDHFSGFIDSKIKEGRYGSTSEAVRAALRLLEADETKLEAIRAKLAIGEDQLERGEFIDGEKFMAELMGKLA